MKILHALSLLCTLTFLACACNVAAPTAPTVGWLQPDIYTITWTLQENEEQEVRAKVFSANANVAEVEASWNFTDPIPMSWPSLTDGASYHIIFFFSSIQHVFEITPNHLEGGFHCDFLEPRGEVCAFERFRPKFPDHRVIING